MENSVVLDDDEKFIVAFVEPNGEVHIGRIRKLTPRECWKLQGFTDDQFDKEKRQDYPTAGYTGWLEMQLP